MRRRDFIALLGGASWPTESPCKSDPMLVNLQPVAWAVLAAFAFSIVPVIAEAEEVKAPSAG